MSAQIKPALQLVPSGSEIKLSPIDDVLADLRQGKLVVIVDDEDRENEGDLIIPAATITPEAINFMSKFGRGLICMPMLKSRADDLGLSMMPRHNVGPDGTAFTVSIEARDGVTTGISCDDRARTIRVAADPKMTKNDIVTPGHVFPLIAKEGGVLVRAGHTEATVDLAQMAGFYPAGVLCEVLQDDGSMARLPDLAGFCGQHGLKLASIADLIAYRLQRESLIERVSRGEIKSIYGGVFQAITYRSKINGAEHIALVKGDVTAQKEPVLVRMHRHDVMEDVFGSIAEGRGGLLQQAMRKIAESDCGILVLLRDQEGVLPSEQGTAAHNLRSYGVGAQILRDLGVERMVVLTTQKKTVKALEGYGMEIADQILIGV